MENSAIALVPEALYAFHRDLSRYQSRYYPTDYEDCRALLLPAGEQLSVMEKSACDVFAKELLSGYLSYYTREGIKMKGTAFYDRRLSIASYMLPALESFGPGGRAAAEAFVLYWNGAMPKNKIGLTTYEAILNGFDKGLYSFIFRK